MERKTERSKTAISNILVNAASYYEVVTYLITLRRESYIYDKVCVTSPIHKPRMQVYESRGS